MNQYKQFMNQVQKLRKEKGLSRRVFAAQFGISPTTLQYAENGKTKLGGDIILKLISCYPELKYSPILASSVDRIQDSESTA